MLQKFLNNKPLFYDEIDYDRMPRAYEKIKHHLKIPKIIHLIGTNGKGTTGRFLASALYSLGFQTGHYTSPHILEFNERIWLNGDNVSNDALDEAHKKLLTLLDTKTAQSLSYFEYTTLLAILIFEGCDYIVLEAGLGGEFDATAVFENILTLVTPIDKDHEAFLGSTIEEIAITKLNAIQKAAIMAKQKHPQVYEIAKKMAKQKKLKTFSYQTLLDEEDKKKIKTIGKNNHLKTYLLENLSLAIAALKYLNIPYSVENFNNSKLFGRVSKISDNILLDVGHNTLAADSLQEMLQGKQFILIYNSYKDKNYKEILAILQPIIKHIEIIDVDEPRVEDKAVLKKTIKQLSIEVKDFKEVHKEENYLVFGSFSVAEQFLKAYNG